MKCGAAYIPLDIRNPVARTAFILTDSQCTAVVGDAVAEFDGITAVTATEIAALLGAGAAAPSVKPEPAAPDTAYYIYTSGTPREIPRAWA
ncbi:MAG TPA: AMP-binding protein [Jatrophihabitans sp.]|uniref:AMP-binding protein n=1 Tax=Jatrophihabitans sp. TaxID=1932789 RepID=UPI002EE5E918